MQNPVSWCANENDDPAIQHPYIIPSRVINLLLLTDCMKGILPWQQSRYIAFIAACLQVYRVHYGSHLFEGEYYYRISFVYPALHKIYSKLKFKRESLTPIWPDTFLLSLRGWKVIGWKTKCTTWRIRADILERHFLAVWRYVVLTNPQIHINWHGLNLFISNSTMSMHNKYISWLH